MLQAGARQSTQAALELYCTAAGGRQAGRQAGRQEAGRQAGRQAAGRQAGRQVGRQQVGRHTAATAAGSPHPPDQQAGGRET